MMKMVQKATPWERFNHWVLLLSFFVLTLTGLGFLYNSLSWINTAFGGVHLARGIHNWSGILFAASLVLTMASYLGDSLKFGADDFAWLGSLGGYLSGKEAPPQGKLNAGQKLFYLLILASGLVISASGVILWIGAGQGTMQLAHLLHNLAFLILVILVPFHVYAATALNPGTFRIMTRGTVPLKWAKKHHPKGVKELGME